MDAARFRAVCSGVAAAALLAGLVLAGRELPAIAIVCAVAAIAAQPRWCPRLDVPAALVALIWIASAWLAPLPGATAMPALTCILVVCATARLPPGVARALFAGCLTLAVLLLALVAAYELATIGEPRSLSYPALDGWGGYPEMGLLGVMTLPVALSLAMEGGPWQARAGAAVAALTAAAGVVLSGSRAAWAAAAVAAVLVLLAHVRNRRLAAGAALGAVLLVALVLTVMPRAPEGARSVAFEVATGSRLTAWGQAVELWRERPVIGWGPASYRRAYASRIGQATDARFHAHSEYLHVAVETGVLGLASALWLAAVVLAGAGSRAAPPGTLVAAARTGLVCGLMAVGVRFLVDYFDPAGAGVRLMLWLSALAGLRLSLEAASTGPTQDG